jgi:hypothetical protein
LREREEEEEEEKRLTILKQEREMFLYGVHSSS